MENTTVTSAIEDELNLEEILDILEKLEFLENHRQCFSRTTTIARISLSFLFFFFL